LGRIRDFQVRFDVHEVKDIPVTIFPPITDIELIPEKNMICLALRDGRLVMEPIPDEITKKYNGK